MNVPDGVMKLSGVQCLFGPQEVFHWLQNLCTPFLVAAHNEPGQCYRMQLGLENRTYPSWEVSLWLKVFSIVLIPFEVPKISLQGKGCQQEVGLLSEHTLRMQHLFSQVPIIIVSCSSVTGKRKQNTHFDETMQWHINRISILL